jgi:tRNA(adenine34) deaminase
MPDKPLTSGPHAEAQHMRQAMTAAQCALPHDVPVGALLLLDDQVIATGYNRRELDNDPTGHAEIVVLRSAGASLGRWRLNDTTLYVTLEPCPMCASAIQQARVGRVVFGAYDPVLGACGSRWAFLMDSPETRVQGGLLEAENRDLLQRFFRERR